MTVTAGPTFLIIGAAKGGTTSLAHYLRQHPSIFVAREKECHHFLTDGTAPVFTGPGDAAEFAPLLIPDRERYLQCFAKARPDQARGEASVYYLYRPDSLTRALEFNPEMKFVAVLRDPVQRAFSAWSHMMRDEREPEPSFRAAFGLEAERMAAGWSYGFAYDSVGRYGDQVAAAQAVIPSGQLHVTLSEDLVADPDRALGEIFDFLGVPAASVDAGLVMNASGTPRNAVLNHLLSRQNRVKDVLKRVIPYRLGSVLAQRVRNWNLEGRSIDPEDAAWLAEHYRPDTQRLAALLGRELPGWSDHDR